MSRSAPSAGDTPLDLTVDRRGDEVRIALEGELDRHTCGDLRRVVCCAFAAGATSVTFDCSELAFLDAGGIRVLAELIDLTDRRGGTVTLEEPSSFTVRLLDVTDLRERLLIR